ncbi:hypothetical protein WME97_01140 [Sorangium sp. So ce367]|uniref:hypothetical protein n=1 Tax=Sorangium sp. So ce367 TaxID=3133305 RepID=UPI003F5EC3DE
MCEAACDVFSAGCAPESCSIACFVAVDQYPTEACFAEFDAYHACLAAQEPAQLACGADENFFAPWAPACRPEWTAYSQCRRTGGADCAVVAKDVESCTYFGDPPDWATCKIGKEPPPGCVPLTSLDYCCPEGTLP